MRGRATFPQQRILASAPACPQRPRTYTGISGTTLTAASTMAAAAGRSASTSSGLIAPSEVMDAAAGERDSGPLTP